MEKALQTKYAKKKSEIDAAFSDISKGVVLLYKIFFLQTSDRYISKRFSAVYVKKWSFWNIYFLITYLRIFLPRKARRINTLYILEYFGNTLY